MTTLAAAATVNGLPMNDNNRVARDASANDYMPTVIVPGYSITVTDYTGTTSEISTGQWVHIRSKANNQFFKHATNNEFQWHHGIVTSLYEPWNGQIAQGVTSADDSTKFMVLVLNGDQKKIQLMDEYGRCFKRYQTDAQYYVYPGFTDYWLEDGSPAPRPPNNGATWTCDEFATLTVGDASDGKGVTLTQGNFKMQNIQKDDVMYLGMTENPESVWQQFSFYPTDAPEGSKTMVQSNLLTNVKYDMANGKANLTPTKVGSVRCSMGAGSAQVVLKQTQSASETSSFSSASNFNVGRSVSVEAGIPETVGG